MALPADPKWPAGTLDEWYDTWRRVDGAELPLNTLEKSTEFNLPRGIEMIINSPKFMGEGVSRHAVHFDVSQDESNIRLTPGDNQSQLIDALMHRIDALFNEVSAAVLAKHPDSMFKIIVYDSPDRSGRAFSTKYLKPDQVLGELSYQLLTIARNYDQGIMGYSPSAMSIDIDYVWGWDGSIRGAAIQEVRPDSQWYQPSIRTYKNCLFASIYLLLHWRDNPRMLQDSRLLKSNTRKFLQRLELPATIKEDPCEIWVNKSMPQHEIFIADGHAEPLIRWRDLEAALPGEFVADLRDRNSSDSRAEDKWEKDTKILSSGATKERNLKIAAWDIETVTVSEKLQCYLSGFCAGEDATKVTQFFSAAGDSLVQMLDHLYDNRAEYSGFTFYAHNGGKFDLVVLLRDTLLKGYSKWRILTGRVKELNGRWINFALGTDDGKVITFRDSYSLMSQSLATLTREFGVTEKTKISGIGEASRVRASDLLNCEKVDAIKRYHATDCVGLLEVLKKFEKIVWDRFSMSITDFMTAASMSKRIFLKRYYSPRGCPVFQLGRKTDAYVRNAYFGGRNECFYIGK
jgi:hypothetical protein